MADRLLGRWNLDQLAGLPLVEACRHLLSPYQSNPLDLNPLRDVLTDLIDRAGPRLHGARAVRHGDQCANRAAAGLRAARGHARRAARLGLPAVHLFQAVEIDGEPYWDGGYMGNPVIWPLIYDCESRDIVLVQINPLEREGVAAHRASRSSTA